jgi:hypothetical protein
MGSGRALQSGLLRCTCKEKKVKRFGPQDSPRKKDTEREGQKIEKPEKPCNYHATLTGVNYQAILTALPR